MSYKLNVIITCDVECWPDRQAPPSPGTSKAVSDHIYGMTRSGEHRGITWQMHQLNSCGLRGVFFVESLFGAQGFPEDLKRVVGSILEMGHDVELHAHTEWYGYFSSRATARERRQHLRSYPYSEQVEILEEARDTLQASGAGKVVAFRAGNFGANDDTIRAVGQVGLTFDSSYNAAYLGRECEIGAPGVAVEPFRIGDVWEYPVTCFRDKPWLDAEHVRPLQITAASRREMNKVLLQAHESGLHTVVILTHSFEMTHFPASGTAPPRTHRLNVGRFRHLCEFLAERQDLFRVATFREIETEGLLPTGEDLAGPVPVSSTWNYVVRGAQNLVAGRLKW